MSASSLHKTLLPKSGKHGLQRSADLTKKLSERQAKKEESKNAQGQPILNPWSCVAIKNEKYAKECVEVFLSGRGAVEISTEFRHFPSLEVVWFNNNRLTELRNLEANFRIQEVYVDNNRLVSLKGLKKLRFLRVLLARNNQLRNLDKQIEVLRSFSFLHRLDLAENAVSDEPDYRLRIIYNMPQVEDLDRSAVKPHDRIRADEVVPNLDKVVEKPETSLRKKSVFQQLSPLEAFCFQEARELRERYKAEEQAANEARYAAGIDWSSLYKPKLHVRSSDHLSAWEQAQIERFLLQRYVNGRSAIEVIKHERSEQQALNDRLGGPKLDPKAKADQEQKQRQQRQQERKQCAEKMLKHDEVKDVLACLAAGKDTFIGRILTDPAAMDADADTVKRTRSVSLAKADGRPRKEKEGAGKAKLAFWDVWKDAPDATKSLLDVFEWVKTLEWSWEEDAVLDERLHAYERELDYLNKLTNRDEDEEARYRCFSLLYNRMEGAKTRKQDSAKTGPPVQEARTRRTDVLPLMQLNSREVIDPISGRTSIGFDRKCSTFRFA